MLSDVIEHYQIIRQSFAPLRLTRWQITKLFAAQVHRDFPVMAKLVLVLAAVLLFWVASVVTRPKKLERLLKLPVISGSRTVRHDFVDIIEEGHQKYPDTPYVVNVAGLQYVVYPGSFFDEIKRLSEQEASAQEFFYQLIYGKWTHVGAETESLWKTIAVDLARSIPIKIPAKQKDARIAFDKFIGYCPQWKGITLFDAFMNIVAMTNACSFVGREVGTGEWAKAVQRLPMATYVAVMSLSWLPRLLRPVFQPLLLLPALIVEWNMRRILKPVIQNDIDDYERALDKKEVLRPKAEGKLPYTQWLISRYKTGEWSPYQLATDHILTSFESTASTSSTLYNIIMDLAVRPDLQDELRREVQEVLVDGSLPSTHLKELRKMDSVMRETFRVNPFSLFSLVRITKKPIQLSSGPKLPAGTVICVDSYHINKSGALFPSPEKFDSERFIKKRAEPGAENRFQFVSTGPDSPGWGDGTQACPGRFFANSVIKICLSHILMNYEVKLKDGQERPQSISMPNGIFAPDMAAQVLFKSRD
ncbi:MAG: hypothetical protein M1820_004115 [Bogoriella megaspora]|nr:MAG: hypothetical protein M1820_004115 [Bogoriella megaspora]